MYPPPHIPELYPVIGKIKILHLKKFRILFPIAITGHCINRMLIKLINVGNISFRREIFDLSNFRNASPVRLFPVPLCDK